MPTQAERIEALEKQASDLAEQVKDLQAHVRDGEAFTALAAGNAELAGKLEEAAKATGDRLDKLEAAIAEGTAGLLDGVGELGEIAAVDFNSRAELLKAFRQIERLANHINVRLPS